MKKQTENKRNGSNKIALFEGKEIRKSSIDGQWHYSITDIIAVLTESIDPLAYWRKLKQRLKEDGNETVTNCHGLKMKAADGKMRLTDVADTEQVLRLIQSVPSPKAEPFKLWLARIGKERLDEIEQPALAIERAKGYYLEKGYDPKWVKSRVLSIDTRNEFTDTLKDAGIKSGLEYAILTNELHKASFGLSVSEYKDLKGLERSDSLRDNMSRLELIATQFSEATSSEIIEKNSVTGFSNTKKAISVAGSITSEAIAKVEAITGKVVVSPDNFKHLDSPQVRKDLAQSSLPDSAKLPE